MAEKLLTKQDAAKLLEMSEEKLESLVASGCLSAYRIGGEFLRFKETELHRYKNTALRDKQAPTVTEKLKDFFYFNDFYIISILIVLAMLLFIFR